MTREEAIEELKTRYLTMSQCFNKEELHKANKAIDMAIKALEQEPILDKIIAEIEQIHLIGYATVDGKREIAKRAVMQIINKYKAESEK